MLYTWNTKSFNKKKNNFNWQNFEHSVKWYLPKIYSQWPRVPSNFHGADKTILIRLCSLLSDDFAASKLLLVSMSSSWKTYWCPYSRVGHWSDSCLKSFCNYKLLQSFDNQLFQFFSRIWFQISLSVQCWRWKIVHILLFTCSQCTVGTSHKVDHFQ